MDDSEYIERLRIAIGCPVNWERFDRDPLFKRALLYYWLEVVENFQVDDEALYGNQVHAILSKSEEDLEVLEINAKTWKAAADREYIKRTAFFREFYHQNQLEHKKHWTAGEVSERELAKSTKKGPAKYKYRYPLSNLSAALYDAVRFNWRRIAEIRPLHLYVRFKTEIGVSKGLPASSARFDLEYSTGAVHSHPIQNNEKPKSEAWLDEISLDKWPGMIIAIPTIDEPLE